MTHEPDPRAEGISTIDYCKLLPVQRHSTSAKGLLLRLPRTGLVIVPFHDHKGGWDAVVVDGYGSYPRGGYHLFVGDEEIATAIELSVGEPIQTRFVHSRTEAEALTEGDVILTAAGLTWAKRNRSGEPFWSSFLRKPITTAELGEDQFPAKVLAR